MWKFKRLVNKQGFTLMEMLFSLMIYSLIFFSLSSLTQSYTQIDEQIRTDRQTDFFHFIALFETELSNYEVIDTTNNVIEVLNKDSPSQNFQFVLQNQKIYKRPGHQILLYDVADWEVSLHHHLLLVKIIFSNEQTFSAYIILPRNEWIL